MDGSIIKHDGIIGEIFPEFVWDPYRIITIIQKINDPSAKYVNLKKNFNNTTFQA